MPNLGLQKPILKPNLKKIRFSFERLQINYSKFALMECSKEYFEALLKEIVRYQDCTIDAFRQPNAEDYRHPLDFSATTEVDGFPDIDPSDEELWTDDPWQFGLPGVRGTASHGWRVHGFIAENVFYIVWLDPHHRLDAPREG